MHIIKKLLYTCSFLLSINSSYLLGQDLLEDASQSLSKANAGEIFSETVNIISRSGKVFILSNSNQLLGKGDFVTMIIKDDGAVARAVVAKTHDGQAGVKVLKVYSLARWKKLKRSLAIDLLKGDDSSLFAAKKTTSEKDIANSKIDSEEDLFNDKALINEDLSDFYKDSRVIKPDNIVTSALWRGFIWGLIKNGSYSSHYFT